MRDYSLPASAVATSLETCGDKRMRQPGQSGPDRGQQRHRETCPTCKHPLPLQPGQAPRRPSFFPFCSQRCKLIDLGAWLDAEYRIPSRPDEASEEALTDESGDFGPVP